MEKRILFFSDNPPIMEGLVAFARTQGWFDRVDLRCSPGGPLDGKVPAMRLRDEVSGFADRYDVVVSGHCKQIFPPEIVRSVRCVNLHPGYNPETRGWYPQVFSILHGYRIGFTVHLMDEEIDNGAILYREEVPAHAWDTSRSLYERVVRAEIDSIPKWLPAVVSGGFETFEPEWKGNYHSKQDFRDACRLDPEETGTFRQFYDRLRATSFAPFRNAWFIDPETGRKLFVRLEVEPEEE
jgi:methionyl-tRNA formyltransferase